MKIAIIGAGAAGCFAAIEIKRRNPKADVVVLEAAHKPLAKVAITGGGRCNLTNSFNGIRSLNEAYPRGARLMKKLFSEFDYNDVYQWFEAEGVKLTTQTDECVFPQSQDAMEIVNTLVRLMNKLGVRLATAHKVVDICHIANENLYRISTANHGDITVDRVVVTIGGKSVIHGFDMLQGLDIEIVPPVPSLFSMSTIKTHPLLKLMGTVVKDVETRIVGTKLTASGPLLITHWGVSGPAILKLSSYAATILAEKNYQTTIAINWFGDKSEAEVVAELIQIQQVNRLKLVVGAWPTQFNNRLWCELLAESNIRTDMRWGELGKKGMNKLVATLTNYQLDIVGKNRFKDEFVTCGGVSLSTVSHRTLESKSHKGLYFAGEVLDVDAITGGFNLQAAWTMGYVVGKSISEQ